MGAREVLRSFSKCPILHIVVPCYNEEAVLPITIEKLSNKVSEMARSGLISNDSRIIFVDDGSSDNTWPIIMDLSETGGRFEGVKLAHNSGHQNALWAGMTLALGRCDCVITIDADLQDDIDVMPDFIQAYTNGADVVYGVRSSRETDTFFKRFTARSFYRLMNSLGAETVYDHADYRLLSARAVSALLSFDERNMFLRGMVPMLGFKTAKVYYRRGNRAAGESKYPLRKMLAFAFQGITSMSIKPLSYAFYAGSVCGFIGVVLLFLFAFGHLNIQSANGFPTLLSVWIVGGLNMIFLGVVGQYVGKIYLESKRRPKFIVDEMFVSDEDGIPSTAAIWKYCPGRVNDCSKGGFYHEGWID